MGTRSTAQQRMDGLFAACITALDGELPVRAVLASATADQTPVPPLLGVGPQAGAAWAR